MRRLGLFGGTFNPPHLAHKRLSDEMRERLSLSEVLIMPTFTPPHKEAKSGCCQLPRRCVGNGAGEVVVNSIDTDGVKNGFDLEMLSAVCDAVSVPVIASGGAGCKEDFIKLFKTLPKVDAGLAASIFHFGEVSIPDLKMTLKNSGIPMRI